jgi:hypothetical protein
MNMPGTVSNKTGWEEPSPPAQRRNIPNYDDGTSLWGNPAQQQSRMGGLYSSNLQATVLLKTKHEDKILNILCKEITLNKS